MKRILILILAGLLMVMKGSAQNLSLIDSIRAELTRSEGIERFELLNAIAWEHRFAHPDSTIYFAHTAFELGKQLRLSDGLARPVNFIGIGYNYKGQRLEAFDYYSRAMEIAVEQRDSFQIAHTNNNIGRLFYDQGLFSKSYPYFEQARAVFRVINDSSGLAYTYQSLGNLYKSQRDYAKAETNFLGAYKIRLALGNPRDIMSALVYLGRHYLDTRDAAKSVKYFLLADSTGHVIHDEINLAEIKTYLAESYLQLQMLPEAEAIVREGLEVILKRNNLRMMPQAYHTMGQVLFHRNDFLNARSYFMKSLEIAQQINDLNGKMDAYYYLWKVWDKLNNKQESLTNQNQYLILKDSVKDLDLAREVERKQFEIEIERKEQENELLKAHAEKNTALIQWQRLQNIFLVVIVGFVSIVGFLQWTNAKKRRATNETLVLQNAENQQQRGEIIAKNEKLSKRNQQLFDLNHEKDTLMSIVAHDLKSPLNRIEGLTYLMELDGKLTPQLKRYVGMVKDATRSGLHLITDLLDVHMLEGNVDPNYSTFDISLFLLRKTEFFQPNADAKNIHLNIRRVENEEVYTDKEYLDRIFDNLLSNAIKFSPRDSIIDIAADRTENEFWISIRDKGPGFSAFDKTNLFQKFKKLSARPTGGESSNGLGLAIVKILVDRLKGNIELISEQGRGSEFVIRFPQQIQFA